MKTLKTKNATNLLIALTLLIIVGCNSISNFSQYSYVTTTRLKVDALNVMDLASEPYELHQKSVGELNIELQKMYEFEKNRPKNEITIKLWDKLLNDDGYLLGGFLMRWQQESKLNTAFINEAKKLVADGFDQIAGLESNKIKKSEIDSQ